MTAFEEMGVLPEIARAVEEMEWGLPTDIQQDAIPGILGGGDVIMAAETGSGKTGAFCLPTLQIVWETIRDAQMGKGNAVANQQSSAASAKWGLNLFDRDPQLAIDPQGTTCQSREQQAWLGCRANRGVINGGKYYYEATVTDEGLCRVGWSAGNASLDLGTDQFGYGYGGTGKKSFNKQFDSYGEPYGKNDVIGCFLDLDKGMVKFGKNGTDYGIAFALNPPMRNLPVFPAIVLKNAEMYFNFGDEPLKFPPGDGWIPLSQVHSNSVVVSQANAVAHAAKIQQQPKGPQPNAPLCIVIEPTRELAEQAAAEIARFKKYLVNPSIREYVLVGGVNAREQVDALYRGVDIVVGTPGRLDDLISSNELSLHNVRFFVLDEADGLISQGHLNFIERLHQKIPKVSPDGKRLQMIVCSATLHNQDIKRMAEKMMHFPSWLDLKGLDSVPDTVHHVVVPVNPRADQAWMNLNVCIRTDGVHANDNINFQNPNQETMSEAVKVMKGEYVLAAIKKFNMDRCLIFCRTKVDCDNLELYLNTMAQNFQQKISCVCLHGDRKPEERKNNLQMFKNGQANFLICTDVAARGLDIVAMPFVINVTLPDETANYIHRIGRVGRADRMGLAISLVATAQEKVWYHQCSGRGQGCHNTKLTTQGGCCIWYNEQQLLGDIEEHLGVTISQVDKNMDVPVDEFEGHVVYGEKRKATGTGYKDHVELLQATVGELAELEKRAQTSFLQMRYVLPPVS